MDTSHRNIYNNYSLTNAKHSQDFDFTGEEIPKRSSKHQYIMKPWTNAEQESLYVAVERLKLFGQWDKVRRIMNLDRTTKDIEEEYTRLYAEIPDSDQELLMDHEYEQEHNQMLGYETAPPTPSLTATSSATPSARSSQDNMAVLFDRSKEFTRYSVLEGLQVKEEDEADEEDIEDQQQQPQQNIQYASTEARTVRMVRVWTPEQSENLKKLIEVYFPGAYRINWVWIAAQMGNAFTRKQCKNKWEIMRRRMGTDDEINLLKQGYQEFGPSWGQIQEKYLPERSRGGISIMWDLLETHRKSRPQLMIPWGRSISNKTQTLAENKQ
ncbi:hypothetical protein BGZ46_004237 [Entomortierella lignicola]|nr:hypothetical protein BGZ46_004237 [Entomortierella lignicola]